MNSIQICNLALGMLGIPAITSFDEPNNNAKLCKQFFPVLRDRVLRDHAWSFATTFAPLTPTTQPSPDPDHIFICPLPGDCIRILAISPSAPYRKIGRSVCVDSPHHSLVYIRRVENPDDFDETFAEALQYLLAAEIGMANTRDPQLVSMFRQEYEKRLAIARSIDSQENRDALQLAPRRSSFLAARRHSADIPLPRVSAPTSATCGKQEY